MKLWIDDVRPAPSGWHRARDGWQAQRILEANWHDITAVSFDHDLGDSPTGYDVLVWIERRIFAGWRFTTNLEIHSANPVGRQNMLRAIRAIITEQERQTQRA